ncbi:hypothetical protein Q1695_012631 [Nippostrongylus brasiliensis]|nr:hypothetical protein Q1695_012631 [Nippostrongylus brasiliensis]
MYGHPDNVRMITRSLGVLHNILVGRIEGNAVHERYGHFDIFEDQRRQVTEPLTFYRNKLENTACEI